MRSKNPGPGPFDVSRVILLAPVAAEKLQEVVRHLRSVEALLSAAAGSRGRLLVSYDSSHIGIRDIEAILDEGGIARASSSWSRFKLRYYRFQDDNARSNAGPSRGACCNRPPAPWSGERTVDGKD